MKLLLSYFLIILFSLQSLPVKELGKLLVKKSATEQVQDADEEMEKEASSKQWKEYNQKLYLHSPSYVFHATFTALKVAIALQDAGIIRPHFVPDIPTPPPNPDC